MIKTNTYQFDAEQIAKAARVYKDMAGHSYEFDAIRDQIVYDLGIERGAANELLEYVSEQAEPKKAEQKPAVRRMKISRKKLISELEAKQEELRSNLAHLSGRKPVNEEQARCILETKSFEGGQYKLCSDVLNILNGITSRLR